MSKPIRIAQILGKMNTGGIESIVMNYYRNIDKDKVQFDFFFHENSQFPQMEELKEMGAGIYIIPSYSRPIKYLKALTAMLKQNEYKIAHVHLSTMSVFPLFAAWKARIPVRICHNHSTADVSEGVKTLLKYVLRPFCPMFATHYYGCSVTAAKWMYGERRLKTGRVHVMPNAIDTKQFCYNPRYRQDIRKEFNISQDAFVVGNIGRFTFAKNHKFLIDVFKCVLKVAPNSILLLVGDGEREKEIADKVSRLNISENVIFAGVRHDIYKFYSAFDVFCLPSNYEGMPVVGIEAQANNLPTVFSTQVPKEAGLRNGTKFLEVSLGAEEWSKIILGIDRNRENKELDGYDIKEEAIKQMEIYIDLYENAL